MSVKQSCKVLHITNGYWSSKLYKELVLALTNFIDEQDVFVPTRAKGQKGINNIDHPGVKIIYEQIITSFIYRLLFKLKINKTFDRLSQKLDVKKYNCIHAHSLFSDGAVALEIYKKHQIPYIVTVRNTDINVFFKYFFFLRSKGLEILGNAQNIIFLSETYKTRLWKTYIPKELKSKLEKKTHIVHNGISPFWFKNQPLQTESKLSKPIQLLFVGNINSNKNIITSIKAINKLIDEGYNILFTIIGKGPNDDKIYLKKLENILNKVSFATLLDAVDQTTLLKYYSNADIFIMNSHTETFGLVYAEALSQGVPVIYTKDEGFDKVFKDGQIGYAVKSTNINDISQAIKKLIENYNEIQPRCIKASIKFDWKLIASQLSQLYLANKK